MRVLWVCNIMPPVIGQYLRKECSVKEGWISGILMRLAKEKEDVYGNGQQWFYCDMHHPGIHPNGYTLRPTLRV